MSQSVLISTFGEPGEAALQRVALAADADAGDHDAIVGAEDAVADVRRRLQARAEQVGADGDAGRGRTDTSREFAPGDAIGVLGLVRHNPSSLHAKNTAGQPDFGHGFSGQENWSDHCHWGILPGPADKSPTIRPGNGGAHMS